MKVIKEIDYIRCFLIVQLVGYHSFAFFQGAWPKPIGVHDCNTYWWISHLLYSTLLESYVFISGFLYENQIINNKNKYLNITYVIQSKIKRLIIPSFIFSLAYILLFNKEITITDLIFESILGAGHMWFLPMLFCLFLLHTILRLYFKKGWHFFICVLMYLISYFIQTETSVFHSLYYYLFFLYRLNI